MTPGPVAINSATFVGIKVEGIPGAFLFFICCVYIYLKETEAKSYFCNARLRCNRRSNLFDNISNNNRSNNPCILTHCYMTVPI
nr:chromate transporter [Acetivibrio straminisolvens]